MYSKRELAEQIEAVKTVKSLAEVYQEIDAISIFQVRNSVAKTRNFLSGVSGVYTDVKQVYLKKIRSKDIEDLPFVKRNGKEVLVFISANQNLYGDLVFKVFQNFVSDVKKTQSDALVVGSVGKDLVERENLNSRVEYFDLADYKPDLAKIQEITEIINKYEKITVYYGEFMSLLSQVPIKTDISGGVTLTSGSASVKDFIFEPSPKAVLEFFETQIIANLFHQKVYEAQLARFAARLISMNQASEKATLKLNKLNEDYLKFQKYLRNKKQLATFSGRVLWGT